MALRVSALGCTGIAADVWSKSEGKIEVGESREQDYGSAEGVGKRPANFALLGS